MQFMSTFWFLEAHGSLHLKKITLRVAHFLPNPAFGLSVMLVPKDNFQNNLLVVKTGYSKCFEFVVLYLVTKFLEGCLYLTSSTSMQVNFKIAFYFDRKSTLQYRVNYNLICLSYSLEFI